MQRLDKKSLVSVKCSLWLVLLAAWVLTIYGLARGSSGVIVLLFLLPLVTFGVPWWLSTFKQVILNVTGRSLIVKKAGEEESIPVNLVKRIGLHPLGRSLSHVTIVFRKPTKFGRTIRIRTDGSDCEQVASMIHQAMDARA